MLAELTVRLPRPSLDVALERERVDQDGVAIEELRVVRARVTEHEAVLQRALLCVERQQRGILQLAEAPLVRVGDEGHSPRPQHGERVRRGGEAWIGGLVGNEQPVARELVVEARGEEGLEFLAETVVDLAIERAFARVDEAARVAERAVDECPAHGTLDRVAGCRGRPRGRALARA